MERREFVQRIDAYLGIQGTADYGPNGLQVEGAPLIRRVVTAVTASLSTIEAAISQGADALIVHHGIFWDDQSRILKGSLLQRVRALLDGSLNLLAYHLPLDRHPDVGNNAPVLRRLGGTDLQPFGMAKGQAIGWRCRFERPKTKDTLLAELRAIYELPASEPRIAFLEGPASIQSLGVVSGGAPMMLVAAIDAGLDAFVTGEVSEYNLHLAREERIHHVSVGHHASERIGPKLLGAWIERELGIPTQFLDLPNPA